MLKARFVNNWKICASNDIHFSLQLKKAKIIFNAYFAESNSFIRQGYLNLEELGPFLELLILFGHLL